jgi:DNA-binding XRE family transcriptional regulator
VSRPTEWLKNARRRVGYSTQASLADALGVSRGAVGNWENGTDRPSMENAERLAVLLKRQRSEVLAKFGYPIGGGDRLTELPVGLPPEWLTAIRNEIAAGVADGLVQVLEQLRSEGLLPAVDTPRRRQPRRRATG